MFTSIINNRGLLTTSKLFQLSIIEFSWNGKFIVNYHTFVTFLPNMRGEWRVTIAIRENGEFSHEEVVGEWGYTWNNLLQEKNICYLKAENKRGDIIYCQL